MLSAAELYKTPGYWFDKYHDDLYEALMKFMAEKGMNKADQAKYPNCSRSYVTRILNGNFNHSFKKFIQITISIDKIPEIKLQNLSIQNSY